MAMKSNTTMKTLFTVATFALGASAIELTPDTWDDATAGKTVFVKFFAPWCGHCKRMKPAWDKLMDEYAPSDSVLVADVDCIGDGKPLCDKVGVKGFPTIKYGNPDALEDYKGGRELETIQDFASKLQPPCNPSTLENCDSAQKAELERINGLTADEIQLAIKNVEDAARVIDDQFKAKVKDLNEQYKMFKEEAESAKNELETELDLGLYKSVLLLKIDDTEEQVEL